MNNFKEYRVKELPAFLVVNIIVVYLFMDYKIDIKEVSDFLNLGLVSLLVYLSTMIIDLLYTEDTKNFFICFNKKNKYTFFRMPGEKIFDNILEGHYYRINTQRAMIFYKEVYDNMPKNDGERFKYQNDVFLAISKKHRDKDIISVSHKEFLLCRDMVSQLITIAFITTILSVCNVITISYYLYIYYIIAYFVLLRCARVRADAYVCNVIVEDLHSNE